jgi:hypothetical protein
MLIKLINVKENPDGSADIEVKYDKEGLRLLIERGVIAILEDYIKEKQHEPQSERRVSPPAVIQPNKRNNTKRRNGVV